MRFNSVYIIVVFILSLVILSAVYPLYSGKSQYIKKQLGKYNELSRIYRGAYTEFILLSNDSLFVVSDFGVSCVDKEKKYYVSALDTNGYRDITRLNNYLGIYCKNTSVGYDYNYSMSPIKWGKNNNAVLYSELSIDWSSLDYVKPIYKGVINCGISKIVYDLYNAEVKIVYPKRTEILDLNKYINSLTRNARITFCYSYDTGTSYVVLAEGGGLNADNHQEVTVFDSNNTRNLIRSRKVVLPTAQDQYLIIGEYEDGVLIVSLNGKHHAYVK